MQSKGDQSPRIPPPSQTWNSISSLSPSRLSHVRQSSGSTGNYTIGERVPSQRSTVPTNPRQDWFDIKIGLLLENTSLVSADGKMPVEEACQMLIDRKLSSLPIQTDGIISRTFDYSDLNAFLLLVLGYCHPSDNPTTAEKSQTFQDLIAAARRGKEIPVTLISDIGSKDPFMRLSENDPLVDVVNIMSTGVHRIAILQANSDRVLGMLSQRRVVNFFWDNMQTFSNLVPLYSKTLQELEIGSTNVICINGNQPVIEALEMMNNQGISSLAVIDSSRILLGNISVVDVQYVTRSSSSPVLRTSCAHFLAIIKFEQGLRDGQDQVPVFSVHATSTLSHTIAKLLATRAHRVWITGGSSAPSPSLSSTSTPQPANMATSQGHPSSTLANALSRSEASEHTHPSFASVISTTAAATGQVTALHGQLLGVVSLTDVLNIFARESGLDIHMPDEARNRRRRASSSSTASTGDVQPVGDHSSRRSSSQHRGLCS